MRYLIPVAALALSACAHDQSAPPAVEVRYQTVTKEVQRPCGVTVPTRPAPLAKPYPSDAVQLAATLAAKLAEWSAPGGFGDRAVAALEICTKGSNQ